AIPIAQPERQLEVSAPPMLDLEPMEEVLDEYSLEPISQDSEIRVDDFLDDDPKVEVPAAELDWEEPPNWPPPEAAAPSKREPSQARKPPRESSQMGLMEPTPLKKRARELDWEPPETPPATRTAIGVAVADPWAATPPAPVHEQSVSRAAAVVDVTPRS